MKLLKISVFFILTTSINAEVNKFNIGGISLGMTPKEVIGKIKYTYNISNKNLTINSLGQTSQFYYNHKKTFIPHIKAIVQNMELNIYFGVTLPLDERKPIQSENIQYTIEKTKKNIEELKELTFRKYGVATTHIKNEDSISPIFQWCDTPLKVNKSKKYPKGLICDKNLPMLTLQDNVLTLNNPITKIKREKEIRKKSSIPLF